MIRLTQYFITVMLICAWNTAGAATVVTSPLISDAVDLPPQQGYSRLLSAHFEVIYAEDLKALATETIGYLEEAHGLLKDHFVDTDLQPTKRTVVILVDNQDQANGVATAVGAQGLVLYAAPPAPYSTIGDYDNWLRNLVIHEYTHYLTLSPTKGFFTVLRWVFGDTVFPNQMWPSWLSEGLAVYAETKFTKRGRGSAAYYATLTRTALADDALAKQFLSFNQLSGPVPDFPFGASAYYAGYGIVDELMHRYGEDAAKKLVSHGSERVPYFLNGTLQLATNNKDALFRDLWSSYAGRKANEYKTQIQTLTKAQSNLQIKLDLEEGATQEGARVSPDGKHIAYSYKSGHEISQLRITDTTTNKYQVVDARAQLVPWFSWSADSKILYYSKYDYTSPFNFESDLYMWSPSTGVKRLTNGLRAKEPALCGNTLYYINTSGGSTSLAKATLDADYTVASNSVVYNGGTGTRVATPRCSPDGTKIYFTMHGTDPNDVLYGAALAKDGNLVGTPTALAGGPQAGFAALFPEPLANGAVLFTKEEQATYSLALWHNEQRHKGKVTTVAQSLVGLWMPSVSAQGKDIYATTLSYKGMGRALIKSPAITQALESQNSSSSSSSNFAPSPLAGIQPTRGTVSATQTTKTEESSYWFFRGLKPRMWSPVIEFVNRRQSYGGVIVGWDDVDQLRYQVLVGYDTMRKGIVGDINTTHRLRLGGLRLNLFAADTITSSSTYLGIRSYNRTRELGAVLSRPTPTAFAEFTPYISADWARVNYESTNFSYAFLPEWRFGAGFSADTKLRANYSIAPEFGYSVSAHVKRFQPSGEYKQGAFKYMLNYNQLFSALPVSSSVSFNLYYAASLSPKQSLPVSYVNPGEQGRKNDLDPPLRGYYRLRYGSKRAAVAQLEYRLPLSQIFRAADTFPFFTKNWGAFTFIDAARMEQSSGNTLPIIASAGGGLLFNSVLGYHLPLNIRLEYARGFSERRGGEHQFNIGISL